MSLRSILPLCIGLAFQSLHAQNPVPATSAQDRWEAFSKRSRLIDNSIARELKFENIGPTIFSGRVADIDVNPEDPTEFYVAYASGGLWHTTNNGTTFTPIFDHEAVMTIGDIAVDWKSRVIWVGTGESNSSRSSYAGIGVFKSADNGLSWQYCGLPESHHIGRIVLHPEDPSVIWVAALGHLYSPNEERGIYISTDAGASWTRTLHVNPNTGGVDIVINTDNPDVLFAAMWERTRRAWNFTESGTGSGIYRSSDGGFTWTLLTGENSGFPHGDGTGRIGLALDYSQSELTLYAVVDNYFRREDQPEETGDRLTTKALKQMTSVEFANVDSAQLEEFLESNGFPAIYTAESIKKLVATGEITPLTLAEYLEDANTLLFDTEIIGAEVYRSGNQGQTWTKTHDGYLDRLYNTYGYYFGQIRTAPNSRGRLYIMGVPVLRSDDDGATWKSINGDNVHGDHHAMWISSSREGHIILGNDGGINISYDDGENWIKCNSPAVGQFYSVHIDRGNPYYVYGGLQDNGVWGGSHKYRKGTYWHSSGKYHYTSYLGGDGMQVQVDSRDNNTLYAGFQFGNYYRIDKQTGKSKRITPKHELKERPYRWNWQTPVHLSRHLQDIVYLGSNKLHRSLDKGESFTTISGDLTGGGKKGDVPYGTLTTIHESPLKFGLIYTGSDDGLIHVTRDFGNRWQCISESLPDNLYVSRVKASRHHEGRVYATLNGYRWDDFKAYIYVSEDYGSTWESIADQLPDEPVNVIIEDPVNANLLYVGTDNGLYISMDRGTSYHGAGQNLPKVPVHDIDIHPESGDMILGTHGRSFYKANTKALRELNAAVLDSSVYAFHYPDITIDHSTRWGNRRSEWSEFNTPEQDFIFYLARASTINWTVSSDTLVLYTGTGDFGKGINYIEYDLTVGSAFENYYLDYIQRTGQMEVPDAADNGKYYLPVGRYNLVLEVGGQTATRQFRIE